MNAAKLSLRHNLPMADSIIFATAIAYKCVIWTQDSELEKLPGVNFYPRYVADHQSH
jgi:predicted nucleic acid-binding protein